MFTLAGHNVNNKNETDESEDMVIDLADKLSSIEAEMHALEEEYRKDLFVHKQVFLHCPPPPPPHTHTPQNCVIIIDTSFAVS
jgi:hypothetical protein